MKNRSERKKSILKRFLQKDEGWTFIEPLIVIIIVLLVSGMVRVAALKQVSKARVAKSKSQIDAYNMALNSYYLDCDRFPTVEQGLKALRFKPNMDPVPNNWAGPYVTKDEFTDSWGNEFLYEVPGPEGLPFGISSFGADGQQGGTGNDADIVSW